MTNHDAWREFVRTMRQLESHGFHPTPYQKKLRERAIGLLGHYGASDCVSFWTKGDAVRLVLLPSFPAGGSGTAMAIESAMGFAFRKAECRYSELPHKVDSVTRQFPVFTMTML